MNCLAKFLAARLRSISYALSGLAFAFKSEGNLSVHLLATVIVLAFAASLGVSRSDWAILTIAIALVWVAELLNTAIEYLCNLVSPEKSESVKRAKDVAAAAVLVAAIAAVVLGALVFAPYLRP